MQFLRKIQFAFKGYLNFTKNDKVLPEIKQDMTGKTFVITGANSGIGFAAAKNMAKLNATIYLICRNQQRGTKATKQIIEVTGNKNVYLILGEMGEKENLQNISKKLHERLTQIDILVHNAGCMIHQRQFTKNKMEKNFATNTFSVYYLTKLLLPLLHAESRIIAVSSGGMLTQKLVTDDIYMQNCEFDGTVQYARNKRQQLCMFEQFAKLYPSHGKFITMHPGWVDTLAVRQAMPDFYQKMKNKLKNEDEGGDTIIYLATAPFDTLQNGEFYYQRQLASKHLLISCTKYDQKQADEMMRVLEDLSTKNK